MERPALGRNDPCRCGSKKKYKACCWEKDRDQRLKDLAPAASVPAAAAPEEPAKPAKPQGQGWWQIQKDRHPGKKS
ncbi:MAG: SEC-C domain-containing protein [Elusimicrobia bacterium]|nr:SEC-C domain-containing protein [Elusimicrobiota bacterium]